MDFFSNSFESNNIGFLYYKAFLTLEDEFTQNKNVHFLCDFFSLNRSRTNRDREKKVGFFFIITDVLNLIFDLIFLEKFHILIISCGISLVISLSPVAAKIDDVRHYADDTRCLALIPAMASIDTEDKTVSHVYI